MELWYSEKHTENVKFSIKVTEHLFYKLSEYQRVDIFQSDEFGRFLSLDGLMMITEKDEFIYHEMMTHTAMAVNPNIENVLIIGGGDGGCLRELVRYKNIKSIDLVEIDKVVIDACKEYFPDVASGYNDNRVTIFVQDGLKFVRKRVNHYDLVIVDSTDPFGPGEGLFTKEFYGNCYKALTENGIMLNQHESPYYPVYAEAMCKAHNRIKANFDISVLYQAFIPTYPSGHWMFGFASKGLHPIDDLKKEEWNKLNLKTNYYNTALHVGSFALPNYVLKLLED